MKNDEKEQGDTQIALQELLTLIAKHPGLADRITITIKPSKVLQGSDKTKKK